MSSKRHFQLFLLSQSLNNETPHDLFLKLKQKEKFYLIYISCCSDTEKSADLPTVIPAISCHLPAETHAQCDSVWENAGLLDSPLPSSSLYSCRATTRTQARQPWEMVLSINNSEHETISQKGKSLVCWLSYFVSGRHVFLLRE